MPVSTRLTWRAETLASRRGPEIAVVDIRRIDDRLIAEAWEIIEPVARVAANLVWWEPAQH